MTEDELLQRIAKTLKKEIGPAIEEEYPKTQAFMAAVVTQKLGRQIGLARKHEAAEEVDLDKLISDLNVVLHSAEAPISVTTAVAELERVRNNLALCGLIEALYANQGELGEAKFKDLLTRVRVKLRASIDRQMEYAA